MTKIQPAYGFGSGTLRLDSATRRLEKDITSGKIRGEELITERMRINARRLDSLTPGNGMFVARQLEHVYSNVLETDRPDLEAFDLFEVDREVPEGAREVVVQREDGGARAGYYKNRAQVEGQAFLEISEERWSVNAITTAVSWDHFEQLAAGYANVQLETRLRRYGERAILEFMNNKTWTGDSARQALGVLNQPYIGRTTFGVTIGDSTAAEDIVQEFLRIERQPSSKTRKVYYPNRIIMPQFILDYLKGRDLVAERTESLLDAILRRSSYIEEIVGVHYLRDEGPSGSQPIIFDRARDEIAGFLNVIPKGFTMLPVQEVGYEYVIPCYAMHGGVRHVKPLNAIIAYATADDTV